MPSRKIFIILLYSIYCDSCIIFRTTPTSPSSSGHISKNQGACPNSKAVLVILHPSKSSPFPVLFPPLSMTAWVASSCVKTTFPSIERQRLPQVSLLINQLESARAGEELTTPPLSSSFTLQLPRLTTHLVVSYNNPSGES